jgi:F-type H+-transporting ATPase subunit a
VLAAAKTVEVGKYPTFHLFGLTFDINVIVATLLAAFIVLLLFWLMHRKLTAGTPGKLQIIFEMITVDLVGALADSAVGEKGKKFVPIGVTIFMFILICNWLNFIPTSLRPGTSYDILPAPTGNINLPLAMALVVIPWVHFESIRARKVGGYVKHYFQPFWAMTPINVIEEVTKPITLTLRLFGNVFAGTMMVGVMVVLLPIYALPFGELLWKPFDDLLLGSIQAYIFMLLTILYFGMAMAHDEPHPTHTTATLTEAATASH